MTTYYLSGSMGTAPLEANVAEATSSPTADVIVTIGSGSLASTAISRKLTVLWLLAMINWLLTDDPDNPAKSGAGTIPMTR